MTARHCIEKTVKKCYTFYILYFFKSAYAMVTAYKLYQNHFFGKEGDCIAL